MDGDHLPGRNLFIAWKQQESRDYLGVVMLRVSKIEEMMSQMIDLQECIGITIGIGDREDNPQETAVAKNFSNDRMHLHFFHTFLSRCFHFTFVETIRSTS